jgi:hypothetical protein
LLQQLTYSLADAADPVAAKPRPYLTHLGSTSAVLKPPLIRQSLRVPESREGETRDERVRHGDVIQGDASQD